MTIYPDVLATHGRETPATNHTLNGTDDVQPILLCPKCKGEMYLLDVVSQKPGRDLLTFQCSKCGHLETRAIDTR
jgi:hypothetical protein